MGRIRQILMACFCILLLAVCTGCGAWEPEPLPEETIEELEDAINAMDVNGMLECMDEDAVKSVTAGMDLMMGLAESVTGFSLGMSAEDLIAVMPLMQGITGSYMPGDAYPQVDFQVTKTVIKGQKATVFFDEINSGESSVINMKKNDGKWQITFDLRPIEEAEADRILVAGEEETSGKRDQGQAGTSGEDHPEKHQESGRNIQNDAGESSTSLLDILSGEALKDYLRRKLEGTE